MLQTLGSYQALNLWRFGVWLGALLLWSNFTANNVFTNLESNVSVSVQSRTGEDDTYIIFLAESKESSDLGGTLRSQTLGVNHISQSRNCALASLDNAESNDRQILGYDAASDRLPFALSAASGTKTAVSIFEQQSHTSGVHNALLHGKALLIVSTSYLEHESFELVADRVARNFLAHATIDEDAELAVIFNVDEFLGTGGRVRNVELHLDGLTLECEPCQEKVWDGRWWEKLWLNGTELDLCVGGPCPGQCIQP
jgi:hypothetical protein